MSEASSFGLSIKNKFSSNAIFLAISLSLFKQISISPIFLFFKVFFSVYFKVRMIESICKSKLEQESGKL